MQIIIVLTVLIIAITSILYVVNDKFEKNQSEFFPNLFKEKYEKEKSVTIKSLAAELLNNKVVSSSDKFVYKFTYIISKGNEEFLCIATNVEINKIENNYIFKNFANLQEECILK